MIMIKAMTRISKKNKREIKHISKKKSEVTITI